MVSLSVGCTERLILDDGQPGGNDGGAECLPTVVVEDVILRDSPGRCSFEGPDEEGRFQEIVCMETAEGFEGCVWLTDGVERCECDTPDFANTCGNGIPTCAGWVDGFNLANAEYE